MDTRALQTFSTTDLHPAHKTRYWREIIDRHFVADFEPANKDKFDASWSVGAAGSTVLSCLSTDQAYVERTDRHIKVNTHDTEPRYCLTLHVSGLTQRTHRGHTVTLNNGDFTLSDATAPHSTRQNAFTKLLLMRVSSGALHAHLPHAERLCGLRLPANNPVSATAGNMLQGLWRDVEKGITSQVGTAVVSSFLNVLALAYATSFSAEIPSSTITAARRTKAKEYIDRNLNDPELTPSMIADAIGISPRYLNMLFAQQNESVASFILNRRLDHCAQLIANAAWRRHAITKIAFSWGFNNASHFARVFKERFGVSPREYRQLHLVVLEAN